MLFDVMEKNQMLFIRKKWKNKVRLGLFNDNRGNSAYFKVGLL